MSKGKRAPARPAADGGSAASGAPSAATPTLRASLTGGDLTARVFFFGLLIGLTIVVLQLFAPYVTDVVLALLFASLLGPVYKSLVARLRYTWLAATVCCLLVAVVIVGPVVFLVVTLSREAAEVIAAARTTLTMDAVNAYLFGDGWLATQARTIATTLGVPFTPESVKGAVLGAVGGVASFLYDSTNAVVSNALVFVFHLLMTLLGMFYFLVDGPRFRAFVLETSPLPDDEDELLIARFQSVGRAIIFGNGIGSAAQGVIGAVAMAAVGFESPVLWGTVMALAAFLPMVGISLITVPAAIWLAFEDRIVAATLFIAITGTVAMVFENVVKTRLIGSQMRMHDFVVLLSILAGMSMFGLMGLLYGPMVVALFLVVLELYQIRYRPQLVGSPAA